MASAATKVVVVDSLFIVAPIVYGGFVFGRCFVMQYIVSRRGSRGGPNLITFFFVFFFVIFLLMGDRGSKYYFKCAIIGPPAKRASKTPFKWRFAGGPMMAQH